MNERQNSRKERLYKDLKYKERNGLKNENERTSRRTSEKGGRRPVIRQTISRKSQSRRALVGFAGEIRWRAVSPNRVSTLPILRYNTAGHSVPLVLKRNSAPRDSIGGDSGDWIWGFGGRVSPLRCI